ncbi:MAG: hypothetical protein IIT58_10225 [Treponema sp.]|nr:hypothetical protein [Treponema sp.]
MSLEKKLFSLISNSREDARRQVTELFLDEHFGTGTKELCSKYEYTVETFKNYSVILKRPTNLNKGFDFIVTIESIYFKQDGGRRHKNPSHPDISSVLQQVKNNVSSNDYEKVKTIIWNIFKLEDFDLSTVSGITFTDYDGNSHPLEIVLLAIRWLFIEQDITYWNFSGRSMLMNGLLGDGLV